MMSEWDKENLQQILMGYGSWFNAKLLRLISDADQPTRVQMHKAFPEQVALSEQNVNCHLHLLAIAQGNLTPTDEDTINDILAEDKSDFNHEEFIRQSEITIQNMINENHNKSI